MQRYHTSNCNSAVNSNSIGLGSARDGSNSSRRNSLLTPYKLKCDKEPLNSRLGPPDFHPQTSNCLEETLNREFLQSGYRETVEGLEEAREITLTQAQSFSRPVVVKCRESIRKCLRAINESRAQKRKAGQVYGVPLSGILLSRPNVFPEQKAFSDEYKKKWIEGLSQPHKRLRTLADHVPHGYRRKSLFEVLVRNNVPLLRATWFIKVNYLNQIRPSAVITAGTPDKTQQTRKELWTKDFVEYLQYLLDEFVAKGNAVHVGEEPSLYFRWGYVVRLMHWHRAEGLLSASGIIDWVLLHLHEKDGIEISQLMLPIIYGFLDDIILSQTYVRTLANVAVRFIRDPSPGGSHLVDNSRRAYTTTALIELLRYLILSVPDTFVAIDCFPLPQAVTSYAEGTEAQYQSLSLGHVVQSIQARAGSLSKAVCGGYPSRSVVRAVQELDRAVANGDVNPAVDCLFEKFCDGAVEPAWVDEITPRLKASLRWIGNGSVPYISSVFLLLEWATCDFRNFRTSPPEDVKLSGGKDFSEVYIVSRILKQRVKIKTKAPGDLFESPGVLHDIVVCWIDQREGDSVKRMEFLIAELIRVGVFYPPAYVRQLLGSGAMDAVDVETGKKHCRMLKHLPASFVRDMFREGNFVEGDLSEVMRLYSNERRLFLNSFPKDNNRNDKGKSKTALSEVKASVGMFLKFPDSCVSSDPGFDESQGSTKKSELTEGPPTKKQKLNEEQVSDEEDNWWVRKGPKRVESPKIDPPLKSTKQLPKGRQKNVRKTQSLAQLAATRTDTNYVASTSHVCDSKISCAHRVSPIEDVAAIGKTLKRLRLPEKKAVVHWLTTVARQLVEDSLKASLKVNQFGRSQDRLSSPAWKLGEDKLSSLLYMIDACEDPLSAAKYVLWLIPKVPFSNIHVGRNIMMQKNNENTACDVAEAFMLSSLRRYERTIIAADLITEVLTAVTNRVTVTISSVGRVPGASVMYTRYLLRKYGNTRNVSEWENSFKASCDKRLAAELDCVRSNDAELGYPFGIPAGVDNVDDFLRQKINVNKLSRIGITMRDIVLRNIDEALREKKADGGRVAQQIVSALMECIRQTGGAAQEGDPNLLSSAVSAVVHSVGLTFSKMTDNSPATTRRVLQIHISCLSLLKEALGQRQNRVFEIALAIEATSALASKTSRNDAKCTAAISALVVGAIVHGVSNLERMVSVFRLKDGLDVVQYLKTNKPNGNGSSRSVSVPVPVPVDVYVHWFRLLVGNCRTVCDGLVAQLVGESYIAAFITMQRLLPIQVVFPPAYSIFSFVIWKQIILNSISSSSREDFLSLFTSMSVAIGDSIKHSPFRNILLRDSQSLYDLVSADSSDDAEFASLVDAKYSCFLPLRGRQFFNAIIDCKFPAESGPKLLDNIVGTLDFLQPAKFHWQWVELRLLLNEQAVVEKVETHDMSFTDAIRSVSSVSENENNIIEVILARLLVRPDAASLFSDLIHLLGKSLEDSMLKQVKWFLGGSDVLYGRKTVRQRLVNIAENKGMSTKARFWKPWGWSRKCDGKIEEEEAGEVTEKALVEVVIPCVDRSSEDSRNSFASELIKQLNNIEQQINSGNRGGDSKSSNRKGMKVGSPGLNKRAESVVLSPTALRSSLSLRLRLLVTLFPSILSDGEPSGRNMRHVLASVIIRLLGSRFVLDEDERFLFDRLLLLLHALLSPSPPCWLSSRKPAKDVPGFDRDVLENLQNELDRMALPASIRWQIQTAMPILNVNSSPRFSISCNVKENIPSIPNSSPRSTAPSRNVPGKSKGPPAQQEADTEIDPWTLLEDGTGLVQASCGSSIGNGDHGNVRACCWLRGAVRVRRADLSYIGPVDDDS